MRWLAALLFLAVVGIGAVHGMDYFIDFEQYQQAGLKVAQGRSADLYELERLTPGKFHYSYFFALAFSPVSRLPTPVGRWVYACLIALAYAWILFASARLATEAWPEREPWVLLGTLLLSIYSANDAFMTANLGIFLAALCLASVWFRRDRPWLAGLFLAVAIVFKVYPVMLLAFYVWARRWRIVLWTAGFGALFYVGVPVAMEGWATTKLLISNQIYVISRFGEHWPYDWLWFQNVPATAMRYAARLGYPGHRVFHLSLILASVVVLAFYLKSFLREIPEALEDRMLVLALGLVPMLLPISWYNVGVFYCPLIALALARWSVSDRVGLTAFALLYCLTTNDIVGKSMNDTLEVLSVPFLGAAILLVCFAVETVREYRPWFPVAEEAA